MDTIIEYLKKPMEVGVYNLKSTVDFAGVTDYLKSKIDEFKEEISQKGRKIPKRILEARMSNLNESLENLTTSFVDDEEFFPALTSILRQFAWYIDKCAEDMAEIFRFRKGRVSIDRVAVPRRRFMRAKPIFDSRLLQDVKDVMLIEKERIAGSKWLLDVLTVKESGLSTFKKHMQSIPSLNLNILKERHQSSQRYVYRLYPWAVQLWLRDERSITVPHDLKSFLGGAIKYFFSGEWRTSIVLSAISVESMLADLFEEENRSPAPDTPLGDLFRQVREKIDFPPEIINAIQMTNEARIAAVHRSRFPVSDRESTNALFGATNFGLWYST